MKKITIITVCYNSKLEIEKTIKSVIEQEYTNIEYIIIDGASTDGTLEIIKEYSKKVKNLIYISEKDNGIYDAMNKGIELATGDYLYFLNAGDELIPNILSKIVNNFDEKSDLVYGNIIKIDENEYNRVVYGKSYHYKLLIGRTICHQAMFIKKDVFTRIGNFDLEFSLASDYEFILRLLIKGGKFKYINIDIVKYDMQGISAKSENRRILYHEYKNSIQKNLGVIYCKLLYMIKKNGDK